MRERDEREDSKYRKVKQGKHWKKVKKNYLLMNIKVRRALYRKSLHISLYMYIWACKNPTPAVLS